MHWEFVLLEIVQLCGSVNFKSFILSLYFAIASRFRLRDLEENRRLQVLPKMSCFLYRNIDVVDIECILHRCLQFFSEMTLNVTKISSEFIVRYGKSQ